MWTTLWRFSRNWFEFGMGATFLLMLCCSGVAAQARANASVPSEAEALRFANQMLSKMTLAEKIGQMEQAAGQPDMTSPAKAEELARSGAAGSFLFFTDPVRINQLQRQAVEHSRLHIPLIFGYDVIHGFRTIAPVPLAMAASWNPELITRTQAMAAREARAAGVHWAFAPMVDIARDARWGRIMEGAGEDPFLGAQVAAAQVRGFQGDVPGAPDHLLVSVKHFAGYGAAEGGRDYEDADISDELLHNLYLRPFHAAVQAGAATFMSAYMNLNGVPATGNKWLLQDLLRDQWGFKGFVVSDWDAVANLKTHGFAASAADAAVRAALAGVNMEMTGSTYREHLPEAVKQGKISEAMINDLVRPILAAKYRLGLFTNALVDLQNYQRETGSVEQRAAVREAAEQTAVLLKNEGDVLPLKSDLRSIAVIGPLADSKLDTMGSWSIHGDRNDAVTIAQGVREMLPGADVRVAKGVEIERGSPTIFDGQVPPEKPQLTTEEARKNEFDRAVKMAGESEAVVLVLGEAQTMSGEAASRASLKLPGEQENLLKAVNDLGKPVVLVLMAGRPLDLTWSAARVPAILNVWYPGTEGGHAVANLLFGKVNPSGHLPITWPRDAGQEPLFYNSKLPQDPQNNQKRYWDVGSTPLYPFGFGLSYAKFDLGEFRLLSEKVQADSSLRVRVRVRNTSKMDGTEVVQLYVHQRAGSTARPIRELKSFARVAIAGGKSTSVELKVPARELSYWSPTTRRDVLEPGVFDVWVGTDSQASLHGTFTVAGQLTPASTN